MRRARVFVLAALLVACGCAQVKKSMRHIESNYTGLPRTITLFSANGDTIAHWRGTFMVEIDSGVVSWIGDDNMERKVTGTVIVEQVKP